MTFSVRFKRFLIVPAVALGVLVFVLMVRSRQGPTQSEISERAFAVRVIPAPEVSIVPRATGYGKVQPGQVWEAVAEVGGKVVEIHPELKKGSFLRKDEVLLRIDPAEYGLAKIRAQADVENLKAKLRELDQKEKNIHRSLGVEKRSLELSKKELERKNELFKKGLISKSDIDQEKRRYLSQKNVVQGYKSSLDLIPAERQALKAELARRKSQLKDTGLDIEKTTIKAPFHCRIAEVNVELAQYAQAGKVLARADNVASSEIMAQMPLYAMKILSGIKRESPIATAIDMEELRKAFGISAVVRLNIADRIIEWKARFSRISETIDPQTGTVGVYVAVDNTYLKARPGERPPLIKNMYCEVELRGRPLPKSMVIPRTALHQKDVYIANTQNRLERRAVTVDYVQGNLASITKGVSPGEMVIVTDIVPAIDGMLLTPQTDNELLRTLLNEATGEVPVK